MKNKTSLNERFRRWLAGNGEAAGRLKRYDELFPSLRGRVKVGRKIDRERMNER